MQAVLFDLQGNPLKALNGSLIQRLPQPGDTDMAAIGAKAIVVSIDDIGTGLGTNVIFRFRAIIVGDDGRTFDIEHQAIADAASTLGVIATAIHDAVVAYGLAVVLPDAPQGYSIAANRMLIPTYQRL